MKKTCSFFGHRRNLPTQVLEKKLYYEIEKQIKNGFNNFLVGTHGDFDHLVLRVLKELRRKYKTINICVCITSLNTIKRDDEGELINYIYSDVETKIYNIETAHFKTQITLTNQCMIKESDLVITYVNEKVNSSGDKSAYKYASKLNTPIINLYDESDYPLSHLSHTERIKVLENLLTSDYNN